ncbi:MAG: hypothetical protein O2782_04460 [bacterium]|nr:hypothetical protein [bacterium]
MPRRLRAAQAAGARFGIRGGRDDETLILIDGLEVCEPYHMKDFNEGAIEPERFVLHSGAGLSSRQSAQRVYL